MSNETGPTGEPVPATIGRYQITGMLGFGAMGAVYKAFDPLIKRTLAVKTIRLDVPKQSPQHKAFIERFYQEARISGTLSHPGIVTLFDIGEEGGVPFLAMEFVDGKTIASVLEQGTRFKPEKVIGLVSQVAAALDYAHSRGVVHRDIKPSNLILHDVERVKVTDFGIAKLADAEITHAGALLGTPSYMSPEQAMGEKLDGRSDIFSLGVCAFEMLSGQQPFPGANVTSILYKLVHVEPVEPGDLEANGLVPQKWREVFHKVLAKKPANRYQTASEFVRDLEYCLGSWFSGLGDETAAFAAPEAAEEDARTVTLRMPAPEAVVAPAAAAPADDVTVQLRAAPEPAAEATVLLRAPVVPPPADEPATVLLAPSATPLEDLVPSTVEMTSPVSPAEATVLMAPPPAEATVLMAPLSAGSSDTRPPEETFRGSALPTAAVPIPASQPPRAGLPVAWVVGVAAVLLLFVVTGLGFLVWQRGSLPIPGPATGGPTPPLAQAPPSSTLAPAATAGTLHIDSEPAGATVKLNGEARGRTPLDMGDLPFGNYDVRVEQKGYDAQTRSVTLDADRSAAQVSVTLSRAVVATGSADVVSTPPGASVAVDGKPLGKTTPVSGLSLKPGARRLDLELEGYEKWSTTLDVVAGQKGRVDVRLHALGKPAKPAPATPLPPAVDTARIYPESEVDVRARRVSGNSPEYPRDRAPRLRSGDRVSVTLKFQISETGEVIEVKVVESAGKIVDDVVLSAARSWRFQPATRHGTPVKSELGFRQTFVGG